MMTVRWIHGEPTIFWQLFPEQSCYPKTMKHHSKRLLVIKLYSPSRKKFEFWSHISEHVAYTVKKNRRPSERYRFRISIRDLQTIHEQRLNLLFHSSDETFFNNCVSSTKKGVSVSPRAFIHTFLSVMIVTNWRGDSSWLFLISIDKIHAVDNNIQQVFQYLDGIVLDVPFPSRSILYSSTFFFQASHIEPCSYNDFEMIRHSSIFMSKAHLADC
jgi:hypothetical protein